MYYLTDNNHYQYIPNHYLSILTNDLDDFKQRSISPRQMKRLQFKMKRDEYRIFKRLNMYCNKDARFPRSNYTFFIVNGKEYKLTTHEVKHNKRVRDKIFGNQRIVDYFNKFKYPITLKKPVNSNEEDSIWMKDTRLHQAPTLFTIPQLKELPEVKFRGFEFIPNNQLEYLNSTNNEGKVLCEYQVIGKLNGYLCLLNMRYAKIEIKLGQYDYGTVLESWSSHKFKPLLDMLLNVSKFNSNISKQSLRRKLYKYADSRANIELNSKEGQEKVLLFWFEYLNL